MMRILGKLMLLIKVWRQINATRNQLIKSRYEVMQQLNESNERIKYISNMAVKMEELGKSNGVLIDTGLLVNLLISRHANLQKDAERQFHKIDQFCETLNLSKFASPAIGRWIICFFVKPEKQEDRLADFEELLIKVWIPQFGSCIGRMVYVWHAILSAGAIIRIGIAAAIVDRIRRAFGL